MRITVPLSMEDWTELLSCHRLTLPNPDPRVLQEYLETGHCVKMGLQLLGWGGTGPLALISSWRVVCSDTGTCRKWTCESHFRKWYITITLCVDLWALEETLLMMVTDAETEEVADNGVLLPEILDLGRSGVLYD